MSIQILEIVLYSHDGRIRRLQLHPGRPNVITGASQTGKSTLIDIVDYCLGGAKCRVAEGIVRSAVAWFGLRLQLATGQAFIARRCPGPRAQSSEECFVQVAGIVETPPSDGLQSNTNKDGLIGLVSGWCGIGDTLHEPPEGQTRAPLAATVRHALAFCFQPQDEIIQRDHLFHKSSDHFVEQSIKDTLPYFLGAVRDDYVVKKAELRRLRESLRAVERQLAERTALRGEGLSRASALLAEARDLGLSRETGAHSWEDLVVALRSIASVPVGSVEITLPEQSEFNRLSTERARLLGEQRKLRDEIEVAKSFARDAQGFSGEAGEQVARLKSIGIFEGAQAGTVCPLCAHALSAEPATPAVGQVRAALSAVSERLDSVARATPQVDSAIGSLTQRMTEIDLQLAENRQALEAIRRADDRLSSAKDETTRRAHVIGRISLYVESLPEPPGTSDLDAQAEDLRRRCASAEEELSDDAVRERLGSISSLIGENVTLWARRLQLGYSASPLSLDPQKLTLVAATPNGPLPLSGMGAGENWVGYHVVAHLALHQWFTQQHRPVPRFLFLDQPSQVYFPPDRDIGAPGNALTDDDRVNLRRMFQLVYEVVRAIAPGFQVIITEHADLSDEWYAESVVERWRAGLKLVPEDWPQQSNQ